jgi:hypothetical protein
MGFNNLGMLYKDPSRLKEQDINGGYDEYQPMAPDLSYNINGRGGNLNIGGTGEDPSVASPPQMGTPSPMWNYTDTTPGPAAPYENAGANGKLSTQEASIFDQIVNGGVNAIQQYISNPSAIPSIAMALKAYNDAGRYSDKANEYANEANPFGKYREGYGQKLQDLYNDPSKIADTAGYQFRLSQGMNLLSPKLASQHGSVGSGFASMQNYAQGLASTEYDNEVKRLSGLAGANIGPETAAALRMNGLNNQVAAENAALGFLAQPAGQVNTGGGGSGSGSGAGNLGGQIVNGAIKALGNSAVTAGVNAIMAGGSQAASYLSSLISQGVKFIDLPDGSRILCCCSRWWWERWSWWLSLIPDRIC